MSTRSIGVAFALAAAVMSGVNVFVNAHAVRAFGDPTLYTAVKNGVATVALLLLITYATAARGGARGLTLPRTRREVAALLAVGVLGGGVAFALFFHGLARTSSADAALIHKTLVLWVAVIAVFALRERFTALHAAAILALLAGQLLTGTGPGAAGFDAGSAMVLGATLLWAVEVALAKRLLRTLSPLTLGAARLGTGLLVLLPASAIGGAQLGAVPATGWLWAVATGILLTAFVTLWYSALARAGAIDVTAILVFGAVITAALNAGVHQAPLDRLVPGLALISLGTAAVVALAVGQRRARA